MLAKVTTIVDWYLQRDIFQNSIIPSITCQWSAFDANYLTNTTACSSRSAGIVGKVILNGRWITSKTSATIWRRTSVRLPAKSANSCNTYMAKIVSTLFLFLQKTRTIWWNLPKRVFRLDSRKKSRILNNDRSLPGGEKILLDSEVCFFLKNPRARRQNRWKFASKTIPRQIHNYLVNTYEGGFCGIFDAEKNKIRSDETVFTVNYQTQGERCRKIFVLSLIKMAARLTDKILWSWTFFTRIYDFIGFRFSFFFLF